MSDDSLTKPTALNVSDKMISDFLELLKLDAEYSTIADNLRETLLNAPTISEKAILKSIFPGGEK